LKKEMILQSFFEKKILFKFEKKLHKKKI
jgi:hypothetical protein